ncbi:MAG: hypothetical protein ACRCWJ_10620 [Casimicrobium sp.]
MIEAIPALTGNFQLESTSQKSVSGLSFQSNYDTAPAASTSQTHAAIQMMNANTDAMIAMGSAVSKKKLDEISLYRRKQGRKDAHSMSDLGKLVGQDVSEITALMTGKKAAPNAMLMSSQHNTLQIKIDVISTLLKRSSELIQKLASSQ